MRIETPYPLGTVVPHYGKVIAIGDISGERYYWMEDKDGMISMMPWMAVEAPAPVGGEKEG